MSKRGKGGTVAEGKRKKREKREKKERHVELKEAKVERPRNGGEREGGGGMDGSSLAAIELVTGRCFEF